MFDDCPICGGKHCISWDSDYECEELGYFTNGFVYLLHCKKCEAQFEIIVPEKLKPTEE